MEPGRKPRRRVFSERGSNGHLLTFAFTYCKLICVIMNHVIKRLGCKSISIYYIFNATLMLLLVFKDDKRGNFLTEDNSFRTLECTKLYQNQNKCNFKVSITQESENGHFLIQIVTHILLLLFFA